MKGVAKSVALISFGVFIDLTQFLLVILGIGIKIIGSIITFGIGAPIAVAGGFAVVLASSFLSLMVLPVDIICGNKIKTKMSLLKKMLLRFAPYLIEFLPYFSLFPTWTVKYIIMSRLKE